MKNLFMIAALFVGVGLACSGCGTGVTVIAMSQPSISQVSPQVVTAGTPSVTLTVQGSNFTKDSALTVNGAAVPTSFVNATTLAAQVSGTPLAQPSVAQLQVKDTNGGQSNQVPLTVASAPTSTQALAIATQSLPGGQVGVAYSGTFSATGGKSPYTWTITGGSLPAGLRLSSAGVLSGTPTTAGTSTFVLTLTDSSSPAQQKSATLSITVAAAAQTAARLTANSVSLAAAQVGSAYAAALSASGGTPGYTWSVSSGSLPAGLALSSAGVISGTPTAAGSATVTVTVKDSGSPVQTASVSETVTVRPSTLSINSGALGAGKTGTRYTATLSATGGTPGYTWSVSSGSLPAGLTFSSTGVIAGTPTAAGSSTFTVKVTDSGSPAQTATAQETIAVTAAASTLTISSSALGSATVGRSYTGALAATGGTPGYTWSVSSGSLPAGLTLSSSTGAISGTPTTAGSSTFTVKVTDSGSPVQTASVQETITVAAAASTLTISSSALSSATVGRSYTGALAATGGTPAYTWSVTSGSLPAGLTLSSSTGAISGTPTTAGSSTFTVSVKDSGSPAQTASVRETITVAAAASTLTISSSALSSATVGRSYTGALGATGGTPGYTWSVTSGSLPAGLTLSSSTGAISGTPTTSGSSTFIIGVKDSGSPAQTASVQETITVVGVATALSINSGALGSATVGKSFTATLSATGGTPAYTWSVSSGSLPAGLTLSSSTGVISGTPTTSGSSTFTVKVTDSASPAQTATMQETIAVAAASSPLSITTTALTGGTSGTAYTASLSATGGTPGYTWSIPSGSLPAGLSLNPATGQISGTPSVGGTASFVVQVSDSESPAVSVTANLSIAIASQSTTGGTTWFVRQDGGTRYSVDNQNGQCDGQSDAPYPGSGVNQHCAFNDIRYMWMDGAYGNSQWVMAGGDTLVIRGCAALPTQVNPDAPHCRIGWDKPTGNDAENFWCAGVSAGCAMPGVPSGTATQHTRILGACAYGTYSCNPVIGYPYTNNNLTQLYGGFGTSPVINLNGSQYVDVQGLEVTTHNGQCTRVGAPAYPSVCNTSNPKSDFSEWGITMTNTSSNISFQDIYVHGFTNIGMGGPIGGPISLNRVSIDFNAFAGWNFDDGYSTADAPGASITQSYVTMVGNGCLEEYPIVHTQFPAKACWDSNSSGFGDSWSGQGTNLASFSCDHCYIAYNMKDGAMGPHTVIHNISLTNSMWVGNMGQAGKWGQDSNATFLFQNNLIVGNCMRMSQQIPGAAQNFALSTGLNGSYLSNFCRAAGDMFDYFSGPGSTVNFNNNTMVTYQPTVFDLGCSPVGTCGSTPYNFTNNIILGYVTSLSYYPNSDEAPGLYYKADNSVTIVGSHNIEYGVRNRDTCGTNGIICSDPLLVNEPAQGSIPPESTLDNFNFHLAPGSPAITGGTNFVGAPTTDYYGNPQGTPPAIGAVAP